MGAISLEPIIEIFIEETGSLLDELKETESNALERGEYSREDVAEIFRITHTIKADSTMVLFEEMAELGRTFEKLLYYYRDDNPDAVDFEKFSELIEKVYEFVFAEVEKVSAGNEPDASSSELCEEIKKYLSELKGEEVTNEPVGPPEQQIYYIAPKAVEKDEVQSSDEEVKPGDYKIEKKRSSSGTQKKEKSLYEIQHKALCFSIRDDSMSTLYDINKELKNYVAEFNISTHSKLGKISTALGEWIEHECVSDLKAIEIKTQKTVEEMHERTGKNVVVKVTGAENCIEKYKVNIISGAIVHLIRNAVDHGIEDSVDRVMAGKSKDGHIEISIVKDSSEGQIIITVADDGMGVDIDRVLRKAERKNLLKKDKEQYTEDEILDFILTPGFSTSDVVGEYSGRGVGMDVVKNNVEEIGGKIKLFSVYGEGFHVSLIIPTNV